MKIPPLFLLLSALPLLFLSPLLIPTASASPPPPSFPLSTSGRWIVDGTGRRVKLACVNWAAHLEPAAAEGLGKHPVGAIAEKIASMGFNCARLTWPTRLLTNASVGSLTLRRSLLGVGLPESAAGVGVNNPTLLDRSLLDAFKTVVASLANNNIMVILDNQITVPGWCCSKLDGNGFFGDVYFDPDEWLEGLKLMATLFNTSTNVVGMSLRNELRGPRQNVSEWYRYMQKGAEVVHLANPNVLVILSGLDYDKDLSFLSNKQVKLTFTSKLVFELHWYGFSDGGNWENGNPNEVCGDVVHNVTRKGLFLLEKGFPLFLSEFGLEIMGDNVANNHFFNCFLGVAAELDLDWAIWALQGSYYVREGQFNYDETYGVLSWDWCKPRNPLFIQKISALQSPFQGPGLSNISPYNIIFHPLTGLCVLKKSLPGPLELGPCAKSEAWNYTAEGNIVLKDTEFCLQAEGINESAMLALDCGSSSSKWKHISDSKLHLTSELRLNGTVVMVCLDVGPAGVLTTNFCKCLSQNGTCDPESQWFKIVSSTRDIVSEDTHLNMFTRRTWFEEVSLQLKEEEMRFP